MQHMSEPQRLLVSAQLVDARGKACPAPIIELVKGLQQAAEVELWADDPAAWGDLYAFCEATGHTVEAPAGKGNLLQAIVRRRPA